MTYHCQQCNQPISTVHQCPVEGCTTRYCSKDCMFKDHRENGHYRFVCKKVKPFEDTTKYIIVPGCNTGLAAAHPIKQGQSIMVETAAAHKHDNFKKLPRSIIARLSELEPRPSGLIKDKSTYLSKFQYNSYNDSIFINFAFMNHSCMPNADFYYVSEYNIILVIALQDIEIGQEITINYLTEFQKNRSQALMTRWNFNCQCSGCTDTKNNILIELIGTINDKIKSATCSADILKLCDKQLSMYDQINASPIMYYEIYIIKSHNTVCNDKRRYLVCLANHYMNIFLKGVIV